MPKSRNMEIIFYFGILFSAANFGEGARQKPRGHLLYFGSHQPAEGSIETLDEFPTPEDFYGIYVSPRIPVKFRHVLNPRTMPAFGLWTDDYLNTTFAREIVYAEYGKKEDADNSYRYYRLADFIHDYTFRDIYMFQDIPNSMQGNVSVPFCLLCSFERMLRRVVLWMSSGGIQTVLHKDVLDSVYCLLEGSKDFYLVDSEQADLVERRHWNKAGGYSEVDVEQVDMFRFPEFQNLPWWKSSLTPGDCLFIPKDWYHHARSGDQRTLAISYRFLRPPYFNVSRCPRVQSTEKIRNLTTVTLLSDLEMKRMTMLQEFEGLVDVQLSDMEKVIHSHREQDGDYIRVVFQTGGQKQGQGVDLG
ncbi:bifunctional peptidase and arginyl-hydroxylase JMJD5-like isoform X2 [Ostrea edulis]|uniref:bifunctional peptidase and arginyl-hydroxylase JMJD5-like isoform X2 n=1 Tax=Ostrea edulis TaxID=37623 RepID=UPI0024AFE45B|nr:bifunctional peptidase and arginyl-hydroxylase JMJD5-like isoform X2 [Ostrea edulis]